MRWASRLAVAVAVVAAAGPAAVAGEVCNLKVVTDANPDYSDVGSLIHSATSNWSADKDKCWAIWYWNHIGRRQTTPMQLHGLALTDPIRQFNDYGHTMCSTVSGVNCGLFAAMGYKVRYWDISLHTVMDVEYDGHYHMYDSSLSAIYTTCDGSRLADVTEIGAEGACAASGGKTEPGHVAKYHCLTSTGPNGFLTGADTMRSVAEEYRCFNPAGLKYRYYFNDWDLGHRYILNLRDNEVYTRHLHRLDADSPDAVKQSDKSEYKADGAYFVPNHGKDPEVANPRYRLRGNGLRTYAPSLKAADLPKVAWSQAGLRAVEPSGVAPAEPGKPGEIVFRLEGANVITSTVIEAQFLRKTAGDVNALAVSTNNGLTWAEVWKNEKTGQADVTIPLVKEVNGSYEVLVKAQLTAAAAPDDARLTSIRFTTRTMLNSKTQPRLKLGKNTVYVGAGEQTGSIVVWPDLQGQAYKAHVVEEKNVQTAASHPGYMGTMFAAEAGQEAYVVFRIDAPTDITRLTYGGRFYNRAQRAHVDLLHSFDGGKTWTQTYSLTDTSSPWDVIHYEKVESIPPGTRSVLMKYLWNASAAGSSAVSIFAVRMEANYKPLDPAPTPLEVTFTWDEPQEQHGQVVTRSHTHLVDKLPATYTIHCGGADHPVVKSLRINPKGAAGEVKSGYSDGKDVGGEKFQERWVTVGKILSTGKPYTASVASLTGWGAGDPDGKILTDGVVGSSYTGGTAYKEGALYDAKQAPEIVVDLGEKQSCGAFRIHTLGYPFWDAMKGQIKDRAEVLVSDDGQQFTPVGQFNFALRWKDIPANYMWTDEETFCGHNFELIPPQPVEARYVKFKLTPARSMGVTEVQVLEKIEYAPFDLKIALPDGKDRSDITGFLPKHHPSAPYKRPG